MTREEAIGVLKDIRGCYKKKYFDYELLNKLSVEAIDMAIEALSQPIVAKHFDIQKDYIYCSPQIAENVKVVVRCKDCRHQRFYINDKESFYCHKSGVVNMHMEDGDGEFFCSYGERKK